MKSNKLIVRSAVTVVATGLSLLSSSNSQAHGRGSPAGHGGGSRGSMINGAIHQSVSSHAMTRVNAARAIGQSRISRQAMTQATRTQKFSRDDRGGHGERERRHGRDDGFAQKASNMRGERERERRHGRDDGRGHDSSMTRGEREPGDDHGRHRERGDDKGRDNSLTRGEREPGDDHGRHHERHDDKGDGR